MSGSKRVLFIVNAALAAVTGLLSLVALVMGGWAMLFFLAAMPVCVYAFACFIAMRNPERPGFAVFAILLGFALIAWFVHFMEGSGADWDWALMAFPALNSVCSLLQLRGARRDKARGLCTTPATAVDCDGAKRP